MDKLYGLLVLALIAVIGATTSNAGSDWLIFIDKEISSLTLPSFIIIIHF